jgi:hypothetical protein
MYEPQHPALERFALGTAPAGGSDMKRVASQRTLRYLGLASFKQTCLFPKPVLKKTREARVAKHVFLTDDEVNVWVACAGKENSLRTGGPVFEAQLPSLRRRFKTCIGLE